MRRSHILFYCRECGHRSKVQREVSDSRICPECRSYGYKLLAFTPDGLRAINATLKAANAKPITPDELK